MPASNVVTFPASRVVPPTTPRPQSLTRTFDDQGRFQALEAARRWLALRGFSAGTMEGHNAIGIRLGHCSIGKWSHLGARDRLTLHGRIHGDIQTGPVTVELLASAPQDAKSAFERDEA